MICVSIKPATSATAMQATITAVVRRDSKRTKTVIATAIRANHWPICVIARTHAAIVAAKAGVGPMCANAIGAKRKAKLAIAPTQSPNSKLRRVNHIR